MYKIVTRGEKKVVMGFDPKSIVVRLSQPIEDLEVEKYLVKFDNGEESFWYDWSKFYIDEFNYDLMNEQREQHTKEADNMKAEWKTETEIKEYLKGKWTQFIDRLEVIMNEEVYKKVNNLITKL